ncbi:MAG: hypothetical protein IBJ18_13265 [Phycisphaerales bacterium]|nr:hypothetical protein [Phycisphaerales bacterium]
MSPHPSATPRPIVPLLFRAVGRVVVSMIIITVATALATWLSIVQLPTTNQPFTLPWWTLVLLTSTFPAMIHAAGTTHPKHDALLIFAAACPLIAIALCLYTLLSPGNSLTLFEAFFLPILAIALPIALHRRWKHHESLFVFAPSPGFIPSNPRP